MYDKDRQVVNNMLITGWSAYFYGLKSEQI